MAKTCMQSVLGGEAVVAVADGGHGLDREVRRSEESQVTLVTVDPIGEPEDDGAYDDEAEEAGDDERQCLVPLLQCGGGLPYDSSRAARSCEAAIGGSDCASIPASCSSSSVPSTATRSPGTTRWSRPGHWAISPPSPGMIATGARLPKCPRNVGLWAPSDSPTSNWTTANCTPPSSMLCELRRRHASTKDGSGERGDIEDAALPRHPLEGSGDGGVRQLGHDADVGAELADAQGGLQGMNLLDPGADHGHGVGQSRLDEGVTAVGVLLQVRHAPVRQHPGEACVGLVVDHDDRSSTEVKLLHNAKGDSLEPTDDDVVAQFHPGVRLHASMLPSRIRPEVARGLNVQNVQEASGSVLSVAVSLREASLAQSDLEPFRRALTGYCYRMLGSGFEAEDAVQETMLRAWRSGAGFEGRSSVRSWLYRIATNVCIDMHRQVQRRARPMDMGPASPPDRVAARAHCCPRRPG